LHNRFVILTNDKVMTQRANLRGVSCINLHDLNSNLRHHTSVIWTSSLILSCSPPSIITSSDTSEAITSITLKKSVYDSLQDGIPLLEKLKEYSAILSSIKSCLPPPNEQLNAVDILNEIHKRIENFKEENQHIDETIDIFNDHLKLARRNTRLKRNKS